MYSQSSSSVLNHKNHKLGQQSLHSVALQLLVKLDQSQHVSSKVTPSLRQEAKSLEFWRSVIAECLAAFFYVFLVCAAHLPWPGSPLIPSNAASNNNFIIIALTTGLTMATIAQCFGHISGAHVSPAVTLALAATRRISVFRTFFYILAQCGGAIAGAALLYGVAVPGQQDSLGLVAPNDALSAYQIFAIEFILSFVLVFAICATLDPNRRCLGSDSLAIGIAYLACSIIGLPASGACLNPARALGPAFVMNRWKLHWVFWCAPIAGGILASLIYEFIFDTKQMTTTVRQILEHLDKELQCREHLEDGTKCPLSVNSGCSSSSSAVQSNCTGYLSVGPFAQPPPSSSFSGVCTDSIYSAALCPSSSGSVLQSHHQPSSTFQTLPSSYSTSIYGTNARAVSNRNPHMLYGPNLATQKY